MGPEIPMDLVMMEILTRLPSKSLMRFKCVSKLCSSLICSQYFNNRFLTVRRPRLYMSLWDPKDYTKSVLLSLAPATDTGTNMSSFVVDHDLTIPQMVGSILQNLHGFMCYTFSEKPQIFNPANRQLVTLPAPAINSTIKSKFVRICYYFGHDPINDQHKVICSFAKDTDPDVIDLKILSQHWVFDLKAGGSWKKLTPNLADFCPHFPVRRAVCVNGAIYYLALMGRDSALVVSFDLRSEEFRMIPVPRKDGDKLSIEYKNVTLVEYFGKVTIFDKANLKEKGTVELWVVEDAENKIWSRKTLVLQPCQLHLVNDIELKLRGTSQNGKVLLTPCDMISPLHFLCYDVQNNDMRKIDIKGIPDQWFSEGEEANTRFDLMFMDQSESVMYLEI